jgi:plasmid stability protein
MLSLSIVLGFYFSEPFMADLLVRNLDPLVIKRLKANAKRKGRSLQQEVKEILDHAAPMTAEELKARFKEIDATFTDGPITISIEDIIREEREKLGERGLIQISTTKL